MELRTSTPPAGRVSEPHSRNTRPNGPLREPGHLPRTVKERGSGGTPLRAFPYSGVVQCQSSGFVSFLSRPRNTVKIGERRFACSPAFLGISTFSHLFHDNIHNRVKTYALAFQCRNPYKFTQFVEGTHA